MTRLQVIDGLDAAAYTRHPLHSGEADWPEKNCYIDLWIEVLHALRLEPLALLGHTLAADFIGDQWTFFKPTPLELRELYGIDVHELTVWRPLLMHALEHLAAGRLVATEVDAYWLPDTEGTDYRKQHSKTTIVLCMLDTQARKLGYFHNAGYFELGHEDFEQTFAPRTQPQLPLFAELVSVDRRTGRSADALAERAIRLLAHHLKWRPGTNPFEAFAPRFQEEMSNLREHGLAYYHQWAFASLRQAGAAFELAASHVQWLGEHGRPCDTGVRCFRAISATCKSLILKGARVAFTGKPFDAAPAMVAMAAAWSQGMEAVDAAIVQPAW
ncbi:MAG TPA: DUF1839 family protein [Ramlibacter sp.]|nr:DUF1839 family protein [Ramlibacter sp.]